eukprot:2089502-Ditylum_brightwellii.AAC.1
MVHDMLTTAGTDTNSVASAVTGVEVSTTTQSDISVVSAMTGVEGMAFVSADEKVETTAQECTSIASVMTGVEVAGKETSALALVDPSVASETTG